MAHRIAVNFVLSIGGGTTIDSSSAGLSFPADRQRFHQLRTEFDAILIGGNTARTEPYKNTPIPLIVLSHSELPSKITTNPLATHWNLSIVEAIPKATGEFGDILIEAGPVIVKEAISRGLVSELFLTISKRVSHENPIDIEELTRGALEISREDSAEGRFLRYRLAPSHH